MLVPTDIAAIVLAACPDVAQSDERRRTFGAAEGEEYRGREPEAEELGYTVDHTGTIIAIDTDGHVRVLYSHTVDADALSTDLAELLG